MTMYMVHKYESLISFCSSGQRYVTDDNNSDGENGNTSVRNCDFEHDLDISDTEDRTTLLIVTQQLL